MKKIISILILTIFSIQAAYAYNNYYDNQAYQQRQQIINNQRQQMLQQKQMYLQEVNRREIERAEQANRDMMYQKQMRQQTNGNYYGY